MKEAKWIKLNATLSVEFYRERTGNEPVRIWLQSLDKSIKIIIGEDISKVQFRWPLGMPLVRNLGDGIHELRSHIPNGITRVLFIVINKRMILLHGFIKKTQKLPIQDLKLAKERAKNYEQQEKKK
ncbi:MAG: type II toxin-antitoxin system RelE/ParE family toxin [Silvanigrellaceae bacterium]|nr:type II toxin-antitoxin system RelE/ParE family toxin [Silvanigrellaceae bacterium]